MSVSSVDNGPSIAGRRLVPWLLAVIAVAVTACIALMVYNIRRSSGDSLTVLAVLPLVDTSAKHDQQYFCDGITEELIYKLALAPRLRIPAAASMLRLRGTRPAEAGKQLGADTVLQGNVRRDGDRLRISVELVRAADNTHLWSEVFEEPVGTVVAIEDRIARAVVDRLKGGVLRVNSSTSKAEAHDLYLWGLFYSHFDAGTPEHARAETYFQRAIDKDPGFALAYVGLADVQNLEMSKNSVVKALELNERLGEAHVALARVLLWRDWDFAAAERELNRAANLSPQDPEVYRVDAWRLAYSGKPREALARFQRTLDLDPLSPRTMDAYARLLVMAHDYRQAEKVARGQTLGRVQVLEGRYDEGIATLRDSVADLGWACATAARREEALGIAARLQGMDAARIYAALNDRDKAFEFLEQARRNRESLPDLVQPDWDKIRDDPRFVALLHQIGL